MTSKLRQHWYKSSGESTLNNKVVFINDRPEKNGS
jgi:hypothetical protein